MMSYCVTIHKTLEFKEGVLSFSDVYRFTGLAVNISSGRITDNEKYKRTLSSKAVRCEVHVEGLVLSTDTQGCSLMGLPFHQQHYSLHEQATFNYTTIR